MLCKIELFNAEQNLPEMVQVLLFTLTKKKDLLLDNCEYIMNEWGNFVRENYSS